MTGEEQLAAESRKGELSGRLVAVRERIAAACVAAGRDPGEVTLVAVTKTFPASDVRLLYELGVRDVGENRDQEAAPKAAECADLAPELTWHFVGQLQTNKAASVVRYARVVHSVDRLRLARVLGQQARKAGRVVTCLIQVSLDAHPDPGRAGAGSGADPRARGGGRRRRGPAPGRRDGDRAARSAARAGVRAAPRRRRGRP